MDLLEELAELLQFAYVSDLQYNGITAGQAQLIQNMKCEVFTMRDFNNAANYISGHNMEFQSISEAKAAIIDCLLSKNHACD